MAVLSVTLYKFPPMNLTAMFRSIWKAHIIAYSPQVHILTDRSFLPIKKQCDFSHCSFASYFALAILLSPPRIIESFIFFSLRYSFTDTGTFSLSISAIGAFSFFDRYDAISASAQVLTFAKITFSGFGLTLSANFSDVSTLVFLQFFLLIVHHFVVLRLLRWILAYLLLLLLHFYSPFFDGFFCNAI